MSMKKKNQNNKFNFSKKNNVSKSYRFHEHTRVQKILLRVSLVVLALVILVGALWLSRFLSNERSPRPELSSLELSPARGSIDIAETAEMIAAETDQAILYLNPSTLNMRLFDKVNEIDWPLQNPDENASNTDKSILNIEFLGENGELTEWNSYTYSVAGGNYSIEQLDNGIRITLSISQGASIRFDDYMPRKISIERYEEQFLDRLDELRDSDDLDTTEHTIFNLALQTAYRKDNDAGNYYLNYVGNPPSSTVKRLIQIAQAVGYTYEDLVADNEAYGILMEERENPQFIVPLELSLDGADLLARVSSKQIENLNSYYQLQSAAMLPNLATATASAYPDGMMFVPDGSGALIPFNQADSNFPPYARQFRDSNYYDSYYFADNYSQTMSAAVFGMIYGGETVNEKSILGIVEDGSVLGGVRAVQANPGSDLADSGINRIYTEVDLTQYARVNVDGPYAPDSARYLVSTGMQDINYQVRYKVLGSGSDYYDMAKSYQAYLMEEGAGSDQESYAGKRAHLEFLGTIDMDKRFVGIPYSSKYSMTDYEDLAEILRDLGQSDLLMSYKGAFEGGYQQELLRSNSLESTNGSKDEWSNLEGLLAEQSSVISPEANFSRALGRQNGFVPGVHGITAFDTYTAYVYEYMPNTGWFNPDSYHYVRVSPWFWDSVVTSFLEDEAPTSMLTIGDLTTDFYADYDKNNMLSAYEADEILAGVLDKLSGAYDLVLDDGFMDYADHASFITNVSRSSSRYASFGVDIPFRQIVLNSMLPYSTETINMSRHPAEYYLLQVAETAALPQFTLTAESSEMMKELFISGFYSTQYSQHADLVKTVMTEAEAIREAIGSEVLAGHEVVGDQLFLSTYDNGVQVLVNYADSDAEFEGTACPSMSYVILAESEAK